MFIGRKKELAELEKVYKQDGFHIFVIAGRAGAGKSTLAEKFCSDKDSIIFTADHESMLANLQRFSKIVLAHYNDEKHGYFPFWNTALEYIKARQNKTKRAGSYDSESYELRQLMRNEIGRGSTAGQANNHERIIVVLDKFEELCERDTAFLKLFTNCVNTELKESNIFMIIISSDSKFLQSTLLNRNTQIFPRISGYIALSPFRLTEDIVEQLKENVVKRSMGMDAAKVVKYSADEVVLREGEVNAEMFKIISGKAICYLGYGTDDEYIVGSLNDGRSFGEYSLLTGRPGMYTVVAFTDLLVLKIDRKEFVRFIGSNINNAVEIMKNMAKMISVLKTNIDMLRSEVTDSQAEPAKGL